MKNALFFASSLFLFTACQSALEKSAREAGYSVYELVGIEKRDLLKKRISAASEEQRDAGESFTDALEKLQQTYGAQGSELEGKYRKLNAAYEDSAEQVSSVKKSREKMNNVATDLFEEWQKEIGEIQSADFKARSRATLTETKSRYEKVHRALRASENQMNPVLAKLKDHVLFLKHNVNAQAIASLKTEGARIEGDIKKLLGEMNESIREADAFIQTME